MSMKEDIINKVTELANAEFAYTFASDFEGLKTLDYGCTSLVTDATVLYFQIKNIPSLLKTGKRLAAKIHKLYQHTLEAIAKETQGHLNCYSPDSFLLIYPKENHNVNEVVDIALKTASFFITELREIIEQHGHVSFSIGIDKGNILGTKVQSDNNNDHILWFGTPIDKAKAIGHECNRPFFVGLSGTVYHHLDEEHRISTKHVLGFKKEVEIWSTVSYSFENVKKHLYQTNLLKSFEEA
ncbi:MAG: hypothetical protein IKT08_09240 [Bacteroidales bacterium]|nr:hypothetical protein [Bacteroidales bacterium]